MTSPNELPAIAPIPEGSSAETKASAAAIYRTAGYSDEALAAAGYAPAAQPTVNAGVQVTKLDAGAAPIQNNDGLTIDQRVSGYKNLLLHITDPQTRADIMANAKAQGIDEAALNYKAPDASQLRASTREAEQAGAMAAPPDAASYEIKYERSFAEALDPVELQAFDVETRAAMHSAGVPGSMAQGFVEAIIDTGEIYRSEAMTDAAKQMRIAEEGAMWRRVSKNIEEDARLATLAYNAFPKAYRDILDANMATHSARAQNVLAGIGRALEYRADKSKGK